MELDCTNDVLKLGVAMVSGLGLAVAWLARASAKCQDEKGQYIEHQHQVTDRLLGLLGHSVRP